MVKRSKADSASYNAIRVHSVDNVVVTLRVIEPGERVVFEGGEFVAVTTVPAGHKAACDAIPNGDEVLKFGEVIGCSTQDIDIGSHVHTHNVITQLSEQCEYKFLSPSREQHRSPILKDMVFKGFRREDGRVGTRNEIWVIATVACVNRTAEKIAAKANRRFGRWVDHIQAFTHPFGCSQLGDDLENTRKITAGLVTHPNAGGVLIVGLGCESNQLRKLLPLTQARQSDRLRFFNAQLVSDELETGMDAIADLVEVVRRDIRSTCTMGDLVVGMQCGGSDGFSGLTANPLVGRICDQVALAGGRAILTEIPEMFGAEQALLNRANNELVFEALASLINNFKSYFVDHHQPVYENPSPGNIEGGITTLEEKSLGAVQKGGGATITDVIRYGESVSMPGLTILEAPGNDAVSSTALVAAGANVLLFTTGRGTPLGFPAPTIKISSNSELAKRKGHWIDFDAGALLSADTKEEVTLALMSKIGKICSGERAQNERNGEREIAIWKNGVTL